MSVEDRPSPDQLLQAIQRDEERAHKGTLKVFLGMCAGVGKTYAMLEAAQKAAREHRDVVLGYVETHGRRETDALVLGLEVIPRIPIVHRGVAITEMDLDRLLARKPSLAIVDELAHTNAPGSRHPKRYQDIQELLDAGIDVFTTLNVQHVESRSDTVKDVTGAMVQETVPDTVLANAEIELVDLSPDDLLQRLADGKVYLPERAAAAASGFFKSGNLAALREMALRLAAERVGQDVRDYMQSRQISGPWRTGHRILVAVGRGPHSAHMIRWTRRMAESLGCSWITVWIETSRPLSDEDQAMLTRHLALAKGLGSEVRTTTDDDIVRGILRIAREQNVTQIIVGKTAGRFISDFISNVFFLQRLVRKSGTIDVHVVHAATTTGDARQSRWRVLPPDREWPHYLAGLGAVTAVTLVNLLLSPFLGHRSVALIFLMTVVGLAVRLNRGPVYMAAAVSALAWNFLFLPPRFTLYVLNVDDVMMLATYFVVAMGMGHLISRIRAKERMDRRREDRATAIYLLTNELGDASTWEEIRKAAIENVERTFKSEAMLLLPDGAGLLPSDLSEREFGAAAWAFENAQAAGRFTDTLPMAEAMYLPLRTTGGMLGVLRIKWRQNTGPTVEQSAVLEGFLRHISLVIDRQRLRDAKTASHLLEESERLSQALLDAVSHELRTPIAAIQTAVSGLESQTTPDMQRAMTAEIREAGNRLNRLVANLLDMARLDSGHVKPNMDWCDMRDIVNAAVLRARQDLAGRQLRLDLPRNLPLVRVDASLVEQALVDLLLNAAVHTPGDRPVDVGLTHDGKTLSVQVADRGPGIPAGSLPHVFEKFYRVPGTNAGGTGLGLSIVKGFVEAQGGRVHAANRPAGGAVFVMEFPVEEAPTV
jgi:two-component system sensor histidine kinase KdpD